MKIFRILILFIPVFSVWAHGTHYEELSSGNLLGVRAFFDSGDAIAGARVLIFAPGEPEHPWLETLTDPSGGVAFVPDRKGEWSLQIRGEGGHGLRINLNSEHNAPPPSFSPGQKIAGSLLILWGTLGTVLYFRRRKS